MDTQAVTRSTARPRATAHRSSPRRIPARPAHPALETNIVITPEIQDTVVKWFQHVDSERKANGQTGLGAGGFQSLFRLLLDRMEGRKVLVLSADEFRRLVRYATRYGEGGLQQRLRILIAHWAFQHVDELVN